MFEFVNDIGNYNERKIARIDAEENNGVGVSTCFTSDEGYETALIDMTGEVYPVERYKTREDAEIGHAKWVQFAADSNNKTITMLGAWEIIPPEEKTLVRK